MNSAAPNMPHTALHRAVWRWHLYAAVFVLPFILLLSVTGAVMLVSNVLEPYVERGLFQVTPNGQPRSPSEQLAALEAHFPHADVALFIPPSVRGQSSEFSVVPASHHGGGAGHGHRAESTRVFVDPYRAEVLGTLNPNASLYAWAKTLHGSLMLGKTGEYLIEIAAGLGVLMVGTGLLLAWPRNHQQAMALLPRRPLRQRGFWRASHAVIGLVLAIPLLFFLLSGLTWTSVWGGKLVQAWSAVPGQAFDPATSPSHVSLNRPPLAEVPWALEPTPMPVSVHASDRRYSDAPPPDLDTVAQFAREIGFVGFRIHLPTRDDAVWTISASTIAGDTQNPWAERVVHLDRYSGQVLATLSFADYPLLGKAMTASIPLHQGDLGLWNTVLNLAVCLAVICLVVAGVVAWWRRLPSVSFDLAPPEVEARTWRAVWLFMLGIALLFPLAAAALVVMVLLERCIRFWRKTS